SLSSCHGFGSGGWFRSWRRRPFHTSVRTGSAKESPGVAGAFTSYATSAKRYLKRIGGGGAETARETLVARFEPHPRLTHRRWCPRPPRPEILDVAILDERWSLGCSLQPVWPEQDGHGGKASHGSQPASKNAERR